MSSPSLEQLGLSDEEAGALGADGATRVRTFRLIILLAQELRTLMDQLLREDGLTSQQAALITAVDAIGQPTLTQAAAALGTTHQNVKQIAAALERKGLMRIAPDDADRRVRRLITTEASAAIWRRRARADQQHVLEWFAELGPEEARTLFDLLLRLERSVRAAAAR